MKRKTTGDVLVLNSLSYFINTVVMLLCLLPFMMVLAGSLSSENAIMLNGFSIFPQEFSFEAYSTIFEKPGIILRAYANTIGLVIFGASSGLFLTSMTAYVLQRKDFEWRNGFSFFFYFTTLFSGGIVPYYILMTQVLGLRNNYLALIIPVMFSVFNLLLMKSFMSGIPDALTEAARIDGCGDFKIFISIFLPLSKPVLATVGLFLTLSFWNDWYNAMLYISREEMYPLQYFLYQRVNNIEAYKKIIAQQPGAAQIANLISMPTQTLKMALTVVVTGPIILAYPFAQKYFVQGITVGAVKG
jgi:putative aldouronate transport system permease protein